MFLVAHWFVLNKVHSKIPCSWHEQLHVLMILILKRQNPHWGRTRCHRSVVQFGRCLQVKSLVHSTWSHSPHFNIASLHIWKDTHLCHEEHGNQTQLFTMSKPNKVSLVSFRGEMSEEAPKTQWKLNENDGWHQRMKYWPWYSSRCFETVMNSHCGVC